MLSALKITQGKCHLKAILYETPVFLQILYPCLEIFKIHICDSLRHSFQAFSIRSIAWNWWVACPMMVSKLLGGKLRFSQAL